MKSNDVCIRSADTKTDGFNHIFSSLSLRIQKDDTIVAMLFRLF